MKSVSKAEIDGATKINVATLRFPANFEARYEADTGHERRWHLILCGLVALALYDVFLISDWRLIPDIFEAAVVVRLAIVTPLALLIVASLLRGPSPFWRKMLQASVSIIVTASILSMTLMSTSPLHLYHHFGIVLVVLFANIVQRLRFPFAVVASVGMFALYATAVASMDALPPAAATNAIMVLFGACVFTLIANYQLERQARRAYLLSLRDRLKHDELDTLSRIDALTGLGNRRSLDRRFDEVWTIASETARPVCVLMLDVDHFKPFNDCYGHPAGDLCLKRIASIIDTSLRRPQDAAFRFGGEEFLVLLPDTDLMHGVRVAERIRQEVESSAIPHEAAGSVKQVLTVSLGVAAAAPTSTITRDEIVKSADAALYAAKRNGRNQVWPPRFKPRGEITHLADVRSSDRRGAR